MSGIILILVLFFVLRFVFRYVLPVATAVSSANRKLREMQNGNLQDPVTPSSRSNTAPKQGDYIDYEEVK